MMGSFIQIHVFVKCFSTRQEVWYVTNPPDMPTGKVRLPRVCIIYQLPAWTPSWIFKFSVMHQLHHWDVTMMMSVTQGTVKSAFCMQFPGVSPVLGKVFLYFCNKLPLWRPFCLHSYFIFIFLLEAKCLQLDSNFIAFNLRKNEFETFVRITQCFH